MRDMKCNIVIFVQVIDSAPTVTKVIGNIYGLDLINWGALIGFSTFVGYAGGKKTKLKEVTETINNHYIIVGKPVRVPNAAMGAVLGTIGGFLLAYQQSSGRLMGFYDNGRQIAGDTTFIINSY